MLTCLSCTFAGISPCGRWAIASARERRRARGFTGPSGMGSSPNRWPCSPLAQFRKALYWELLLLDALANKRSPAAGSVRLSTTPMAL
jgi:hypothetical protein